MDRNKPLSDFFSLPHEVEILWIRFLEKSVLPGELPIANKMTTCLMSADIYSIRNLLRQSLSSLSNIKRYEMKHEDILLRILWRIHRNPDAFLARCQNGKKNKT